MSLPDLRVYCSFYKYNTKDIKNYKSKDILSSVERPILIENNKLFSLNMSDLRPKLVHCFRSLFLLVFWWPLIHLLPSVQVLYTINIIAGKLQISEPLYKRWKGALPCKRIVSMLVFWHFNELLYLLKLYMSIGCELHGRPITHGESKQREGVKSLRRVSHLPLKFSHVELCFKIQLANIYVGSGRYSYLFELIS